MATLNLIPNPAVLVTQVGVFLASFVVIKKLYVEPYLDLRQRRQALTVGSKEEAVAALAESAVIAERIEQKMRAVIAEAKRERDSLRDTALAKRQTIVHAAEADAKKHVAEIEGVIRHDLGIEKAKIPAVVASLTEEVYKLALA